MPHHYHEAIKTIDTESFAENDVVFQSEAGPRGVIKFVDGTQFVTRHRFPGLLPSLPSGIDGSTESTLVEYLDNYEKHYGVSGNLGPWYPGTWATDTKAKPSQDQPYLPYKPADTYTHGKLMGCLMEYCIAAEAAGSSGDTYYKDALHGLETLLTLWLNPKTKPSTSLFPGHPPAPPEDWDGHYPFYYFAYHRTYSTMLGYPSSFGATTSLNDHHFHYGYFIHAAAYLALKSQDLHNPDFVKNYGPMIDLLVADIACTDAIQRYVDETLFSDPGSAPQFTKLRYWDWYEGHGWATGYQDPTPIGVQQESSSEAINAWAGMVLWGQIADRPAIRDAGIALLSTHIASVNQYHSNVNASFQTK